MISDIYYALDQYYQSDIDTLTTMQELTKRLASKYGERATEYYNHKAISLGFCPYCLTQLKTKEVITNTHEYMGKPVDEKHIVLYCDCCNEEFN